MARTLALLSIAVTAAVHAISVGAAAVARTIDAVRGGDFFGPKAEGGVLGANTLTGLIPDIYEALDVISRELVGFIPAVFRNSSAERAALNQNITIPMAPEASSANNTPGVTAPDSGDQVMDNVQMTISKSKHVPVRWSGEEAKGLQNAGTFTTIQADRFYQAFRTLVNEIETDLYLEGYRNSSRAYGTAGTTPFATAADNSDFAGTLRILEENGCPTNDLQLVLGHAAIANLRGKQSNLFKVNEAGSADMLRNGMTDRIMKFALRASNAIGIHTKGTGSGYLVNNASGIAVGGRTIAVDTGSGTILAGDIITAAADSANKYVVNTALATGSLAIGRPGARVALPDNNALTVGNNYTPNLAFARNAIGLVTRAPAMPPGGDMADDAMMVTDPVSGLTFEIAVYRQFLQVVYHVRIAWGQRAIKPPHIATLIG